MQKVSMINAILGQPIGHAKTVSMMEGDFVDLDVESFFPSATGNLNNTSPISDILHQLAGIFFVSQGNTSKLTDTQFAEQISAMRELFAGNTSLQSWLSSELTDVNSNNPQAFLSWIFLNKELEFIPASSGVIRVNHPDEIENLEQQHIAAPESGYLFIYVSNHSATDVSFDNLTVALTGGALLQTNDYYPYGMLMNDNITSQRLPINNYFYSTKERNTFASNHDYDFGFRWYDASTARWNGVDPIISDANPFLAMKNNPVSFFDADGRKSNSYNPSAGGAVEFADKNN